MNLFDPANPVLVGGVSTPDWAQDVSVSGSHACIAGGWSGFQILTLQCEERPIPTAAPTPEPVARRTALGPGTPNPFRRRTTLRLMLVAEARTELAVYDVSGRLVRDLIRGVLSAGEHSVTWDGGGTRVAAGTYFVRMTTYGSYGFMSLAYGAGTQLAPSPPAHTARSRMSTVPLQS